MPVDLDKFWLVLHKCRGEPCLDICTRLQIEDEVLFVTSTGHGCHAIHFWRASELISHDDYGAICETADWAGARDMFTITKAAPGDKVAAKAEAKAAGASLLGKLGLGKAPPPPLTFGA